MDTEFADLEPVADFIAKIGERENYTTFRVDLAKVGHLTSNRVVVDKTILDLFAARLYHASPELYRDFVEAFPGADAGTFVGGEQG